MVGYTAVNTEWKSSNPNECLYTVGEEKKKSRVKLKSVKGTIGWWNNFSLTVKFHFFPPSLLFLADLPETKDVEPFVSIKDQFRT